MEGWWGILKSEMYCLRKFTARDMLATAIDDYILYYNTRRYQKRLNCLTPCEFFYSLCCVTEKLPLQFSKGSRIVFLLFFVCLLDREHINPRTIQQKQGFHSFLTKNRQVLPHKFTVVPSGSAAWDRTFSVLSYHGRHSCTRRSA